MDIQNENEDYVVDTFFLVLVFILRNIMLNEKIKRNEKT